MKDNEKLEFPCFEEKDLDIPEEFKKKILMHVLFYF